MSYIHINNVRRCSNLLFDSILGLKNNPAYEDETLIFFLEIFRCQSGHIIKTYRPNREIQHKMVSPYIYLVFLFLNDGTGFSLTVRYLIHKPVPK